jgi:enolase
MSEVVKLEALEILDSRGNPTLSVTANGKQLNSATVTKNDTGARAY